MQLSQMAHCIYYGDQVIMSKNIVFLSLKIDSVFTNSADPGEIILSVALYLGLHCLQKYQFRDLQPSNG